MLSIKNLSYSNWSDSFSFRCSIRWKKKKVGAFSGNSSGTCDLCMDPHSRDEISAFLSGESCSIEEALLNRVCLCIKEKELKKSLKSHTLYRLNKNETWRKLDMPTSMISIKILLQEQPEVSSYLNERGKEIFL